MDKHPTGGETVNKPGINDVLAMERTSMANERTFLAYIRTALTMVVPGVTGFHLAETSTLKTVSFLFIPLGVIIFIIGVFRFVKKRKIKKNLFPFSFREFYT